MAITFLLAFGGSPVYLAIPPQAGSAIACVIGAALAEPLGSGNHVLPDGKKWVSQALYKPTSQCTELLATACKPRDREILRPWGSSTPTDAFRLDANRGIYVRCSYLRLRGRMRLLGWLGIFLGAVVFGTILALDDPSQTLNEALFRWQTLITGFLATAAAYSTIIKMTEIDKQAERRNSDLIAAQVLRDRLVLERAHTSVAEMAAASGSAYNAASRLRQVFSGILAVGDGDDADAELIRLFDVIRQSSEEIQNALLNGAFAEALELMGVKPIYVRDRALAKCVETQQFSWLEGAGTPVLGSVRPTTLPSGIMATEAARWVEVVTALVDKVATLRQQLDSILDRYPVLKRR